MNILLAFYPIDDMGGIINHNEQLAAGLQELGHQVDSKIFLPRPTLPRAGVGGGKASRSAHTGLYYDQRKGYTWPNSHCVPYMGAALPKAKEVLAQYDVVIWQVAVPTKRKENRGNSDWLELYGHSAICDLAVIHDGNFLDSYPWLWQVADKIRRLICVHHCAYESARYINIPRQLVYNPQEIDLAHTQRMVEAFPQRAKGFLSLQTFKAWKHVPELVAAVPHTTGIECHLAGKGIDYYYLTSKDKCKWPGVWPAAIEHGMVYHDVVTNDQRDELLRGLTCLVDPSWSKKYSAIGGHFNRVVIDGLKQGCVPIVRPLGIGTNLEGKGELFSAGENCLAIPQGVTPKEYGEILTAYCNIERNYYEQLMNRAVPLLGMFERKKVANLIMEGFGEKDPAPEDLASARTTETKQKAEKVMGEFFNV